MTKTAVCLSVLIALCLALAGNAAAQGKKMYSWTDENGVVHFSDTEPEGQDAQAHDLPQEPASTATASPYQQPAAGEPSIAEQRRQEIARKKEQAHVNRAVTEAQCSAWKSEVDRLEPSRRVFYTNEQGETERMDDVERTNRVAELKGQIARNCK